MLVKCIFRLSPPVHELQAKSGFRATLVCSVCARLPPFRGQRLCLFFLQMSKRLGFMCVSASCAWTVIICQPLIALPNNLEYFSLFHRRCFPNWLWSGNVCQITNKWEKRLLLLEDVHAAGIFAHFWVHWNVLSGLCDTQCSAMTWMCLRCGKGIKNSSLPSLHQECIPPDFGFPVGFESGKTKRRKV